MSSLERLRYLVGEKAIERLNNSRVAIIGLGGVGGVAAITLARSGVGTLIIQDFDIVQVSNINRQIIANHHTIGMNKADLVEDEIRRINPNCQIIKFNERFNQDSKLFINKIDFLIDAIDAIDDKYFLITECLKNKIPFISAMGAAKKLDIKKLEVTEITKTTYDPLAKILRKKLRDNKIYDKIMVVSSTEEPAKIAGLGSYMPVTAGAGLMLADYVIKQIIKE